jgi:indolepyruvate ferredoxin oxidoreductase beta subunit
MRLPINLIITGVGGQGNVLASQIIGRATVKKGLRVTIGETFGLSQRGGPVMSHVRIYKDGIKGPLTPPNGAHIIVGLEPLEALRVVQEYGNHETIYLVNKRPIHPLNVIAGDVQYPHVDRIKEVLERSGGKLYWLDATTKAMELGSAIIMNTIMLGAISGLNGFPIGRDDLKSALDEILPDNALEINHQALDIGISMVRNHED